MAKDNLFLGFARGKVGSVVFYRAKGEQITRALNSAPSNPQTALQLLQRVCFKSSSVAYSLFQDITDHSFEGVDPGTPSQSRFAQRNIALMRAQLADEINSGDEEEILTSQAANFDAKSDVFPPFRPFVVSEGHAPSLSPSWGSVGQNAVALQLPAGTNENPSYDDIIAAWGIQRGDQVTLLFLSVDDTTDTYTFNGFAYARIIMEPANGDFTTPFVSAGKIASPNARNRGDLIVSSGDDAIIFEPGPNLDATMSSDPGTSKTIAGIGVIVSRQVGNIWQRSDCTLLCRSDVTSVSGHLQYDHSTGYLADAIASYRTAGAVSTAYLNQAQKAASADV